MSEQGTLPQNWIGFWVYVCAAALLVIAFLMLTQVYTDGQDRISNVGRSVGYAVGERHQLMTHITSDPTENYLIPATPEP